MPEVLLSNDSLTVLGGPASISLGLDVGPAGKRGSAIFLSNGNPNIPGNVTQTPSLLDLAINVNSFDDSYKYVYQYLNVDGINTWVEVIDLSPGIFSTRMSPFFVNGTATVEIPLSKIVQYAAPGGGVFYPEMFTLQVFVSDSPNPIVVNGSISSIDTDTDGLVNGFPTGVVGQQVLTITLNAYRIFNAGGTLTVEPLDGTAYPVNISIQATNYEQPLAP